MLRRHGLQNPHAYCATSNPFTAEAWSRLNNVFSTFRLKKDVTTFGGHYNRRAAMMDTNKWRSCIRRKRFLLTTSFRCHSHSEIPDKTSQGAYSPLTRSLKSFEQLKNRTPLIPTRYTRAMEMRIVKPKERMVRIRYEMAKSNVVLRFDVSLTAHCAKSIHWRRKSRRSSLTFAQPIFVTAEASFVCRPATYVRSTSQSSKYRTGEGRSTHQSVTPSIASARKNRSHTTLRREDRSECQ